jgi:hypothetical protein
MPRGGAIRAGTPALRTVAADGNGHSRAAFREILDLAGVP